MNKKLIVPIIFMVILFVLFVAYVADNPSVIDGSGEKTLFNVSSGHSALNKVTDYIKTSSYYEGYDVEVVKWMESLGNKQVFFENGNIIIMGDKDSDKLSNVPDVTDAYVYVYFTAKIVENHALGIENRTVYYVEDVDYVSYEIIGNGLA